MGRLRGGGLVGSLAQPHRAGLEDGARLASVIGGVLLIGAGVLHLSAAGDHTDQPVMAAGFVLVGALQGGLGGLMLFRRPGRLVSAGAIALTLAAIGAWIVSRTAGLPFGGHEEPVGFTAGMKAAKVTAGNPTTTTDSGGHHDRPDGDEPGISIETLLDSLDGLPPRREGFRHYRR